MGATTTTRRCVIYARISVSSDESVSIERQLEASEQYAEARGWQVVGQFVDDGVSATKNRPQDRDGWRALIESADEFDVAVVWKLDRLARRTQDFLNAHETLMERGAAIATVEDQIDMTTASGEFFATVLAGFGQMEAATISARVAAARSHLVRNGRAVGGKVPYGWRSVPNPAGAGRVLAQDPVLIDNVRNMVERVERGDSLYSVVQWLNETGIPTPTGKSDTWVYSTVERILRHPILAGMTPFNPGNDSKARGSEVLRGPDGLPVIDEALAIMPAPRWRAMCVSLDSRDSAQSRPRASKSDTSALLSGLVFCGMHLGEDGTGTRMWRGRFQSGEGYHCPVCGQAIANFEGTVIQEFLDRQGDEWRMSAYTEVKEGGAALLPKIEAELAELSNRLAATDDDAEADTINGHMAALRRGRRAARATEPEVKLVATRSDESWSEAWEAASTVEDRRAVLSGAVQRIWVIKGRPGRRAPGAALRRLAIDWTFPDPRERVYGDPPQWILDGKPHP